MAKAKAIRLALPDGTAVAPTIDDDDKGDATIADLTFKAPFTPAVTASVVLPADIKDESGRPLSNAERFPLEVRIDEAPPLVKFAAAFGILEASEGGVLPVTRSDVPTYELPPLMRS